MERSVLLIEGRVECNILSAKALLILRLYQISLVDACEVSVHRGSLVGRDHHTINYRGLTATRLAVSSYSLCHASYVSKLGLHFHEHLLHLVRSLPRFSAC